MKFNKIYIVVTLWLASLLFILPVNAELAPAIIVKPHVIEHYDFYETFDGVGQVKYVNSQYGIAKKSTTVEYVTAMQGKQIAKGDTIILLDSIQAMQAAIKAEAELKYAQNAVTRDESLYASKVISEEVLEESKISLERAMLEVVDTKKNLEDFIIRAPFDGIVDVIKTRVGDEVNVGDRLFTIIAPGKKEIIVELPQTLDGKFNDKTSIYASDAKGSVVKGKLIAMSSALSQSGTLATKVLFDENSNFLHDSYVKVMFEYNQHSSLAVPEKAVMKNNTGDFVYKITKDNKIVQLYIETGIRSNDKIEILSSNILAGDKIVLEGLTKVFDGSEVQFVPADNKEAISGE